MILGSGCNAIKEPENNHSLSIWRLVIKKLTIPIVTVVLITLGGALFWQRGPIAELIPRNESPPQPAGEIGEIDEPRVKVITAPVEITRNDRIFEAVGTGRARLSVQIYSPVSEEITAVNFKAQDRVTSGDVLLKLDDRDEILAVRMAEVELEDARSLLDRYEQAVQAGGVPQSEVDSARAAFEGAQVAADQARLQLEKRSIKAPFGGVVGIPRVDPGDRVDPQMLLTTLDDRSILHVDYEVPEALAGALQDDSNRSVTATTPAFPDQTFKGDITAQESRIDPLRRTLMVRASIENPGDTLRPGMSFHTRWEVSGPEYPTVPEIALQWGRDGSYVWIIRDGIAHRIMARVRARSSGRVLVEGDIQADERVVVEGLQRLRPEARVEMLDGGNG